MIRRIIQISDEAPTPSFFLRFCEPVQALGIPYAFCRGPNLVRQRIAVEGDTHPDRLPLLAGADVVVFQRAFSIQCLHVMKALKAAGKPVVYETDDLLFDLPPWSGFALSAAQKVAVREMIAAADLVTCSTGALAVRLGELNPRVRVIENYAAPADFEAAVSRLKEPLHLAIVNTDYFKLVERKADLFAALDEAIGRLGYHVTFLGSVDPAMRRLADARPGRVTLEAHFIPHHRRFLERLAALGVNVAIAPLEVHAHHQCKSDIKFLDFGSIAVPAVFNNPQVYSRVIHQENGFLCDGTKAGWYAGLAFLADSENRLRCGEAAYRTAQRRTVKDYAAEFEDALRSVLHGQREAAPAGAAA